MSQRKIVIEPDPILRKKSEPLEKVDDEIRELGFNSSTYWDDLAKTLIKVITN